MFSLFSSDTDFCLFFNTGTETAQRIQAPMAIKTGSGKPPDGSSSSDGVFASSVDVVGVVAGSVSKQL